MDVGVTMSPTTYFFTVLSPTARPAVSHRAAFAKTAHFATKTGQVAMTDLCREWGMSKTQWYEILKRWRTEETVATKSRSGRPRVLTDADMHTLECLSEERKGYFTWESLAALFTERTCKRVSYKTVYNSCKTAGWRALWTTKVCMPPFFSHTR